MHTCIHIRQKRIFEADKLKPGAKNTNYTEQERRSEISNKKQKQKKSKITWITESVKVLHIWKIQKETKPWDKFRYTNWDSRERECVYRKSKHELCLFYDRYNPWRSLLLCEDSKRLKPFPWKKIKKKRFLGQTNGRKYSINQFTGRSCMRMYTDRYCSCCREYSDR